MNAYSGLHKHIGRALMGLDDAICAQERAGGSGYTAILIPANPGEPIAISLDGKPVRPNLDDAVACALMMRGEASSPARADLPPEAFGVELDPLPPWAGEGSGGTKRADREMAQLEDIDPPVIPGILAFMPQEKRAAFVEAFNGARIERLEAGAKDASSRLEQAAARLTEARAEIERMRPVVEAAIKWQQEPKEEGGVVEALLVALTRYRFAVAKAEKESAS